LLLSPGAVKPPRKIEKFLGLPLELSEMLPYELHIEILKNSDYETFISYRKVFPEIKFNDVFKFLYNEDVHVWGWAAANGHLEVIEWLHENRSEGCTKRAMDWAAEYGHLEVENRSGLIKLPAKLLAEKVMLLNSRRNSRRNLL
jgi:hypothetical protein